MAEQANKVTAVVDRITKFFSKDGKCSVDVRKYQAMVSFRACSAKVQCWETIACQQEITVPTFDREMIEVDNQSLCSLFDTESTGTWKEYSADATKFMDEYSQDLYYKTGSLDRIYAAYNSDDPFIVVIEVNDERRTQFAFRAYLKSFGATFVANSDSSVSMIPVVWQPTGEPFITEGVELTYCVD